jgi:hypothetical protein
MSGLQQIGCGMFIYAQHCTKKARSSYPTEATGHLQPFLKHVAFFDQATFHISPKLSSAIELC